jgi:hypothetical protein
MRFVWRVLLVLFVIFVVVIGLETIAAESGEVSTLITRDASGEGHATRVWTVEDGGHTWLRAGNPQSGWLLRIQQHPAVDLQREDAVVTEYTAVPDVSARDRINDLMRAKYGWADAYIGMLFGRDDATPIRLEPR